MIAQTKANLHDKTFLADMAEGSALRWAPGGLRNADNDLSSARSRTRCTICHRCLPEESTMSRRYVGIRAKPGRGTTPGCCRGRRGICLALIVSHRRPGRECDVPGIANQMLTICTRTANRYSTETSFGTDSRCGGGRCRPASG